MRYVTLGEVVELHRRLLQATGGAPGSATSVRWSAPSPSPRPPSGALVQGHPFIDGNKRVGHAAMETFLVLDGSEIDAPIDAQERVMLDLAAGRLDRSQLTDWLRQHLKSLG